MGGGNKKRGGLRGLSNIRIRERKKGGKLDLPWGGEVVSLGAGQRVGAGSEFKLRAPSSSRASHLRLRCCPVFAVSGRISYA